MELGSYFLFLQEPIKDMIIRTGIALALCPFLAGTLNAGCALDHRLQHAVPEQWKWSNIELLPHGQSLCTM
jgi:hypothetical protein